MKRRISRQYNKILRDIALSLPPKQEFGIYTCTMSAQATPDTHGFNLCAAKI
jgi:hypothetical protein